jgi:hypothetical protein
VGWTYELKISINMKKLFLVGTMLCALGMMSACKSGTANNKEKTLVGHLGDSGSDRRMGLQRKP